MRNSSIILGTSCITPYGNNVNDLFDCMNYGRNQKQEKDKVEYTNDKILEILPRLDITGKYLLTAIEKLLKNCTLAMNALQNDRIGVIIGTRSGVVNSQYRYIKTLKKNKPSPIIFRHTANNLLSGLVCLEYKIMGYNTVLFNGDTSGCDAIILADLLIRQGIVDYVIVGSVDLIGKRNLGNSAGDEQAAASAILLANKRICTEIMIKRSEGSITQSKQSVFKDQKEYNELLEKEFQYKNDSIWINNYIGEKKNNNFLNKKNCYFLGEYFGNVHAVGGLLQVILGIAGGEQITRIVCSDIGGRWSSFSLVKDIDILDRESNNSGSDNRESNRRNT